MTAPADVALRFLEVAAQQPDHPAVVANGRTVSYATLAGTASRLAARLAAVSDHPRVMIHVPQGADAYAAMLGTLLAGGYYAPNNLEAPARRQALVVERFEPEVIVTRGPVRSCFRPKQGAAQAIDMEDLSEPGLDAPRQAHEIAYVMFTSGSTGVPKGVVVPRRALDHYAAWARSAMSVTPEDRWSQHPNIAFDLSVLDIYGALTAGATLYPLAGAKDRLMPASAIRRLGLTIWSSVPSVVDLMRQAEQVTRENLGSLRLMSFCGEPLLIDHLDAIFAARPDLVVHNTYGPTEATVSCTLQRLTAASSRDAVRDNVALGEAIAGMSLDLVGGAGSKDGEIVIAGPQVALGYWRDPEATRRAFHLREEAGECIRSYRTGDWARRIDGRLYFAGRRDHQVKIKGHRIELGAIDAALRACGIVGACTRVVDGRLHAFIEAQTGSLDEVALRQQLAALLSQHEIPETFHVLQQIPRSSNDKIDAEALIASCRDGRLGSVDGNHGPR